VPDVVSVGNKAVDSSCNFGSIQAAISAAADSATCAAGTRIILNQSGDYTNQHLTITNKNITLMGRANAAQCGTPQPVCGVPPLFLTCPTAPLRTIEGNIKIRGASNVTIQYLDITHGNGAADGNGHTWGGGIDYAATGRLDLYTSTVDYNTANDGGGIRFQGYGGHADLYLHSHTQIDNNTATSGGSGGGIRVEGDAKLYADEANIWIHDNIAPGKGGGIIVIGPASAHIGSSGDIFFGVPVGVVYNNTANYGGGIAVFSDSIGGPMIEVDAADPNHPVRIERNRAYHTGGGIYLGPSTYTAYAMLGGAQIDGNAAQEGSGIYVDLDSSLASSPGHLELKAGHCAAGIECNTVSNNRAVATDSQGNETPTAGSAILLQTQAFADLQQLAMRGNTGAHVLRVADGLISPLGLDTCLIAGNTVSAELITLGNASAFVNQCTFANNNIGAPAVLLVASDFSLTNSIFVQKPLRAVDSTVANPNLTLDYILAIETDISLSGGQHILYGNPSFVDPANGDFHLGANSLAIDKAPPGTADDRDLDNRPRDQDISNIPNVDGPRDLGAYERQSPFDGCGAADTIFCNGFDAP
jgi:hypothetical protein